jgi:hypothetical protein
VKDKKAHPYFANARSWNRPKNPDMRSESARQVIPSVYSLASDSDGGEEDAEGVGFAVVVVRTPSVTVRAASC